jgi:PAS domain S-box-containing protein
MRSELKSSAVFSSRKAELMSNDASKLRQDALFYAARDAIFVVELVTGMILDANPAAEAMCGRSLAELRLLQYRKLVSAGTAAPAGSRWAEISELSGLTEALVLHRDGRRIPVEITSSHFTTEDTRRMTLFVCRDNSERNAALEAVRRSEERFRQFAEVAGDFIWEVDENGLYTYASPAVETILGYTPEEVVGKVHFYDLFVPQSREEMWTAAFGVFARGESFRAFPSLNLTKDGTIVALETTGVPFLDEAGNLLGYRGVARNVTERRQHEAALREDEERFRKFADTAPVMIWASGPDKLCTFFNKSWLDFTGRSIGEEVDNGWATYVHP